MESCIPTPPALNRRTAGRSPRISACCKRVKMRTQPTCRPTNARNCNPKNERRLTSPDHTRAMDCTGHRPGRIYRIGLRRVREHETIFLLLSIRFFVLAWSVAGVFCREYDPSADWRSVGLANAALFGSRVHGAAVD